MADDFGGMGLAVVTGGLTGPLAESSGAGKEGARVGVVGGGGVQTGVLLVKEVHVF